MNFKDLRARLDESTSLRNAAIPAPMLVLRRRGIRIFPDGRNVALYTNDKYNLVFTIPYGNSSQGMDSPIVGIQQGG